MKKLKEGIVVKKYSKFIAILLAVAMILPGLSQIGFAAEDTKLTRLYGNNAVETAIAVSQEAYDEAKTVVIAGRTGSADALTGTLLAASKNAPLLIAGARKDSNTEKVVREIKRLGAKNVIILGGEDVVKPVVKAEFEAISGVTVKRIDGGKEGRWGTAAALAKEASSTKNIFLALGRTAKDGALADALAIGPAAAKLGNPVLLTKTNELPKATKNAIEDLQVSNVTIVGGDLAVSPALEKELKAMGLTVNRVEGKGRYETAVNIAKKYFENPENLILASGLKDADALVGGYFGEKLNAPILLTRTDKLADETKAYMEENKLNTYVLGGTEVVKEKVLEETLEAITSKEKEEQDITVDKDTELTKDYKTVKVTGDNIRLDLGGNTVETMTITGNDTTIKNGKIINLNIEKDVTNVTLEDIEDEEGGEHNFGGGGAESIVLKGNTRLKAPITITSTTPIQIRAENLNTEKAITGKVTINTDKPVTIAVAAEEIEVVKENKSITIKAEVGRIAALADANVILGEDVKPPKLEKAPGVTASTTDSTGTKTDFTENTDLKPVDPKPDPKPDPEQPGGGTGGQTMIPVTGITVEPDEFSLAIDSWAYIETTVEPANATNKNVKWSSSDKTVATVDSDGKITALALGKTTITVTSAANSSIKKEISLTVGPKLTINGEISVGDKDPSITLNVTGDTFKEDVITKGLHISVFPNDGNSPPQSPETIGLSIDVITVAEDLESITIKFKGIVSGNGTLMLAAEGEVLEKGFGSGNVAMLDITGEQVASLSIKTAPTKTNYVEGQALDLTGLVVTIKYNDASTEDVALVDFAAKGLKTTPANGDTLATSNTSVTITHEASEKNTTQDIKVVAKAVEGIAIKTQPSKLSYIEGQKLNLDGLEVTLTYNDGEKEDVAFAAFGSKGITTNPVNESNLNIADYHDKGVTVSYYSKTANTNKLNVIAKAVTNIAITTPPTKTTYVEGQTFNSVGMVVTATYNDDSTEVVTGYTVSPDSELAITDEKITISYEGKTVNQSISVLAKAVESIDIAKAPIKTSYIEEEALDLTGLVVKIIYNDGTEEDVALADFGTKGITTDPTDGTVLTTTNTKVTITYDGKTVDRSITVSPKETIGDLMHAAAGTNFTGALYKKGSDIYYNQMDIDGKWGSETLIVENATDGRLALDSTNNPHVVYTKGAKIGYRMYDGSDWTAEVFIESNNAGTCSKPDIDVDSNGKAHVTYTDTRGNSGDPYDEVDIMYATNSSGSFVKTLIYNGYKSYISGANQDGVFFAKGSRIAVDGSDNYYVLSQKREWYKWMGGSDHSYSVIIKSNLGEGSTDNVGYSSTKENHDIYDICYGNGKVIALYKGDSTLKTAELTESAAMIIFSGQKTITGTPHTVATDGTNIVVGGLNVNKLQTHYNGTATTHDDILVKTNTTVSVVHMNDKFYAIYTDNSDGKVKAFEIVS